MDSEVLGILYLIAIPIAIIPGLLSLILFVKIWGMTNDVRKITETLKEWLDIEHPVIEDDKETGVQKE